MLAAVRTQLMPLVAETEMAATAARRALGAIESKARQAVCAALPVATPSVPAELYTLEPMDGAERADHPSCEALFPKAGWDLDLAGSLNWDAASERVLEYYDRVLDTGEFERALCPRAVRDLSAATREMQAKLPEIVGRSTATGVAIAGMVARAKTGPRARIALALEATLLDAARRARDVRP